MIYIEMSNVSGLLVAMATSGMLLPAMREVILTAVRSVDHNIIDVTGDQK